MEMSTKESFYIPAGDFCGSWREKASKVVDDSRGNFLFIPERSFFFILSGEVLVDPAWES